MKIFNKKNLYILSFLVIIIAIYLIYYFLHKSNKKNNVNSDISSPKKSIEIIISRYNEDLKWTLEYPFNKYKYIVYNKGDNDEYEKTNVISSINLINQGKCDHTYLYHMYHHYYQLSDIVVFLPGCLNENYFKVEKAKLVLELIEIHNEAFFIADYKSNNNILDDIYYFKLDNYKSMSKANLEKNDDVTFRKSKIRPFGKWYKNNFDYNIQHISLFGIFSLSKIDIHNHNKSVYFKYMRSLEGAVNDELSHYFERSWEAIVYPMKNTYILNYTNVVTNLIFFYFIKYSKYKKNEYSLDQKSIKVGPTYWDIVYFVNRYTHLPI